MKKEVLHNWIKALESGKYKKIRSSLRTDEGFCAMGVLCDISQQATWQLTESKRYRYFKDDQYLPKEICEWAKITPQERSGLIELMIIYNDTLNYDFSSIVKILKDKYKINDIKEQ